MKTHDFILTNLDTDSLAIAKPDQSSFTEQERKNLITELNSLLTPGIEFADDGYFTRYVVLKAKNYIMYDGKKMKIKGSALKSATLEPRLKEMLKEFIDAIVYDKMSNLQQTYNKYVKEIRDGFVDPKLWAKKMTLSEKTFNSPRENEQKVIRAIAGKEYKEGDKVYVFITEDEQLAVIEEYKANYNKDKYYEKIFKCVKRFETVLDVSMFLNYKLKKNKKLLEEL